MDAAESYRQTWANPARAALYTIGLLSIGLGALVLALAFNTTEVSVATLTGAIGGGLIGLGIQALLLAILLHGIGFAAESAVAAVLELKE